MMGEPRKSVRPCMFPELSYYVDEKHRAFRFETMGPHYFFMWLWFLGMRVDLRGHAILMARPPLFRT
jgi:hypothetical protein